MIPTFMIILVIITYQSQRISGLVRNYGEICNNSDECSDHRYKCLRDHSNTHRCLCDKFHEWQGIRNGCVQLYSASEILNMTVTLVPELKIRAEKETEKIFYMQAIAGLFILSVVILSSIIVGIYCIYTHVKDARLRNSVVIYKKILKESNEQKNVDQPSTSAETSLHCV